MTIAMNRIEEVIRQSIEVKKLLLADPARLQVIGIAASECVTALRKGNRILFCGNGGSAADAQHLAAELSGRFYADRDPLAAEALHTNTSYLTAVANDYSYDEIFARLVKGNGRAGDVLFCLSTSGNSPNILKAIEEARRKDIFTIGLTGASGGAIKDLADLVIRVPSADTPRIQEAHILIGHIVCELIENQMSGK